MRFPGAVNLKMVLNRLRHGEAQHPIQSISGLIYSRLGLSTAFRFIGRRLSLSVGLMINYTETCSGSSEDYGTAWHDVNDGLLKTRESRVR